MPKVNVFVTLKPTLLDAQGRVVLNSLNSLGFVDVNNVRIGKFIQLDMNTNGTDINGAVSEMCGKLLANPVIEDYRFEVVD